MRALDELLPAFDVRFRAYWLAVAPCSALIRRRRLSAVRRGAG